MDNNTDAEWWGTTDVAEYLGLKPATISSYRGRGQMPEQDMMVSGIPMWRPATIRAWAGEVSSRRFAAAHRDGRCLPYADVHTAAGEACQCGAFVRSMKA